MGDTYLLIVKIRKENFLSSHHGGRCEQQPAK